MGPLIAPDTRNEPASTEWTFTGRSNNTETTPEYEVAFGTGTVEITVSGPRVSWGSARWPTATPAKATNKQGNGRASRQNIEYFMISGGMERRLGEDGASV